MNAERAQISKKLRTKAPEGRMQECDRVCRQSKPRLNSSEQ